MVEEFSFMQETRDYLKKFGLNKPNNRRVPMTYSEKLYNWNKLRARFTIPKSLEVMKELEEEYEQMDSRRVMGLEEGLYDFSTD